MDDRRADSRMIRRIKFVAVVLGVVCLYERFWEKSHMEEKESHSQVQEEIEESEETIDPDETDGIMYRTDKIKIGRAHV